MSTAPVILITGASSGIGEATARVFARQGYRVILSARRMDRLQALADQIQSDGGQALPIQADLAILADIRELAKSSLAAYGQIDVLFNNAGFGRLDWLEKLDPLNDIQAQIQVNLLGLIQMTHAVLPHMIERRKGHIINMASMAGWVATPTYTIYAATKFAVRGFSEALRREVGIYNIHISVIYPGAVSTEFSQHARIHRKTGISTPKVLRLKADQVAQVVWNLAQKPHRAYIMPWPMRTVAFVNAWLPSWIDMAIERRFTRRERLG
jgi:short-subunit dehydrogenase